MQQTLEGRPACDAAQPVAAGYGIGQTARAWLGGTALEAAALGAFAADQDAEGWLRAAAPSGIREATAEATFEWVIWLADYVAWTGDRRLGEDLYPSAARCLAWVDTLRDGFGLLEIRAEAGPRRAVPEARGEAAAQQALYARALGAAADLAAALGDEAEGAGHRKRAEEVARIARERLWDEGRGLFADWRHFEEVATTCSPLTNYYALYGGLATAAQAERIVGNLWRTDRAESVDWGADESPAGRCVAAEALLEHGRGDLALR